MSIIVMQDKQKAQSSLSVPEVVKKRKKEITENLNRPNNKKRNSLILITNNLILKSINKSENSLIYIERKIHRGSNASMPSIKLKKSQFNQNSHRFSKELKNIILNKDNSKISLNQIKSVQSNPKVKINPNRRVSVNLVNLELENFQKQIKIINNSICKKKKKKQMKKEKKKIEKRFRRLSQKFTVCDSLDESESDNGNDFSELVISSEGNFIFIFDLIVIVCALYVFIFAPLNIATSRCFCEIINESLFSHLIIYFIDIIYILDLFISFFREFYDYEYKIVNSFKEIFFNNLKNGFIFDLIEAVPFGTISNFICKNNFNHNQCFIYNISNFHIFMKICLTFKILKIMKITGDKKNRALDIFYEYISKNFYLEQKIQLSLFILECLLVLHVFICFHIFLGYQDYPNWIVRTGVINSSFLNIYITSFYSTITTMTTVGYGDITCVSFVERNFQIILLAIGIVAYSYIITTISNSIQNESYIQIKLDKNKTILEEIRIAYPLMPFNLYSKINKHLIQNSNNEKKSELNFLLNSLPDIIKGEVLFSVHKKYIDNFKIFKGIQNSNFILSILSRFIPIISKKEELILTEGNIVEKMVFVKDGRLSLEACVNLEDPYESIYKYLEKNFEDFSEENENRMFNNNTDNNNNLLILNNSMNSKFLNDPNKSFNAIKKDLDKIIKKNNLNNKSCISLDPSSKSNNLAQEIGKLDISENEIENDDNKNIQHLKILDVRKNEHFGNIYITLNKLAPLSLKVKSKIADIFILTRKQVIDISKSFPNIWKRITIKSYRNTISIKSMTIITLQKFCELHGILDNEEINDLFNCYLQKNSNILSGCITVNENKGNENSYNIKGIDNHDKSSIINSDILDILKIKNLDNQSYNSNDINSLEKENPKNSKDHFYSKFRPKHNFFSNENLNKKNNKKQFSRRRHSLSTPNASIKKIHVNPKSIKIVTKSIVKISKSCKNSEKSFKNLDVSIKSLKVNLKNKKTINFNKKIKISNSNNILINRNLKIDEEETKLKNCNIFSKSNKSIVNKDKINITPKFNSFGKKVSKIKNKEIKKYNPSIKSDDETVKVSKTTMPTLDNLPEYLRQKIRKKIKKNHKKDIIKKLLNQQKNDIKKNFNENTVILDQLLDSSFNSDEESRSSTLKNKNFDIDSLRSTTYSFSIRSSYENFDKLTNGYISKYKQLQKDIKNLVKKYLEDNKNLIPGLSVKNKITKKQSRNKGWYKDHKPSKNKISSKFVIENENIIENKQSNNIERLSSVAENYEKFNSI